MGAQLPQLALLRCDNKYLLDQSLDGRRHRDVLPVSQHVENLGQNPKPERLTAAGQKGVAICHRAQNLGRLGNGDNQEIHYSRRLGPQTAVVGKGIVPFLALQQDAADVKNEVIVLDSVGFGDKESRVLADLVDPGLKPLEFAVVIGMRRSGRGRDVVDELSGEG